MVLLATTAYSQDRSPTFYQEVCPQALPTIKKLVCQAVAAERRMGASLLRLHFHDCFVNGCDTSVLLDDTDTIDGERTAFPNLNSIRGFEVIDRIKAAVDRKCGGPVVSRADILAVAARDYVVALGGPTWTVRLGRIDSTTASRTDANNDLPPPFFDLPNLIASFNRHGLDLTDLVALSGGHTLGLSQCQNFRDRIYNETNIKPGFARRLQRSCPRVGGDSNLAGLDKTSNRFDSVYFKNLVVNKGLLHSEQVLFNGGSIDALLKLYRKNY